VTGDHVERDAAHPRETVVLPGRAVREDGADGVPATRAVAVTVPDGTLAPAELLAVTRNMYVSPFTRPDTECLLPDVTFAITENVAPLSVLCHTSYEVTAAPLEDSGVDQPRFAVVPNVLTVRNRGADGAVTRHGVVVAAVDGALLPTELTAITRTMCGVPPASPVRTVERTVEATDAPRVHDVPPSTEYSTRYPVTEEPPLVNGVDQYTVIMS
jgi:hypothetical protein